MVTNIDVIFIISDIINWEGKKDLQHMVSLTISHGMIFYRLYFTSLRDI